MEPLGFRHKKPDLHMPISIRPARTSNSSLVNFAVDKDSVTPGEILNYEVNITNSELQGGLAFSAALPDGIEIIEGSLSEEVLRGTTSAPFEAQGNTLNWGGELSTREMTIQPGVSPLAQYGYHSISIITDPFGCPSNCDEGGFVLNVPEFTYNGKKYSQVIWSVNGTVQVGTEGMQASSFFPSSLPFENIPNNLLAPLWTDLDLGAAGARWYTNVLSTRAGIFIVFEWENVPIWSRPESRHSFQVWIEVGDAENIFYVYGELGDLSGNAVSVGAENETGTYGYSYYHSLSGQGSAPVVGEDLAVTAYEGGSAKLSFQAQVKACERGENSAVITRGELETENKDEDIIAVTRCVEE